MARPGKWMVPAAPVGRVVESSQMHFGRPVFTLSAHPDDICLVGELADEPAREGPQWVDLGTFREESTSWAPMIARMAAEWPGDPFGMKTDGARGGR